jgi:hypothetical protein
MNVADRQNNYQAARKWKAYPLTTIVGTATQNINLPGTAKTLLGLTVSGYTGNTAFVTMTINNMVVFEGQPASIFERNVAEPIHVETNLLVTGNDTITIQVTDTVAQNIVFNLAYQ